MKFVNVSIDKLDNLHVKCMKVLNPDGTERCDKACETRYEKLMSKCSEHYGRTEKFEASMWLDGKWRIGKVENDVCYNIVKEQ